MGNVIGIVQARMGSFRLPGKSLAPLLGRPMLQVLMERVRPAQIVDHWIIATTQLAADDCIAELSRQLGIECFRGSENDCLDRYYQAALQANAHTVVRLTGDNPLMDGSFVDWSVSQFLNADPPLDYTESSTSKTFPLGLSLEVFSFDALGQPGKKIRRSIRASMSALTSTSTRNVFALASCAARTIIHICAGPLTPKLTWSSRAPSSKVLDAPIFPGWMPRSVLNSIPSGWKLIAMSCRGHSNATGRSSGAR